MSDATISPDGQWRWDGAQWVPFVPITQAGYPYAPTYPAPMMVQTTNGMAIASMVLGILWIYWIGSILALIFGYVALTQIKQSRQGGKGMAIAGVILGWFGLGLLVLIIVVGISAGGSADY